MVGGGPGQVESLGQRDAPVLQPDGDRALPGVEPEQVRDGRHERVRTAQDQPVECGGGEASVS